MISLKDQIAILLLKVPFRSALIKIIKTFIRIFRINPMNAIMKKIEIKGVVTEELNALEVFGGYGDRQTKDYAEKFLSLDIWELDPQCEQSLKDNFPNALIKITNSYDEIKTSQKKYGMIIIDSPPNIHGEYCEYFDIFPEAFRVTEDVAILIITVVTEINPYVEEIYKQYYDLRDEAHHKRRGLFYNIDHPLKISYEDILQAHEIYIRENGYLLEWSFFQKRRFPFVYAIHKIKRVSR